MLAVLVIDCGEDALMTKLADAGRMPALAAVRDLGLTVPLRSDAHILDGGVFQTLLTGVDPGEHGIYKYRQLVPGTYEYRRSLARLSPVPQVWTVLSERGRECCVFDMPKLFRVNGFRGQLMGPWGAYSPAARPDSIPRGLRRMILRRFGAHPQPKQEPLPVPPARYEAILDRLVACASLRAEICICMMKRAPCEFFMTAFSESHVACRQFWHLHDPSHPMFDAASAARCGDAMERVYAAIDAAVGRIVQEMPHDARIVLMTQQGVANNLSGSHLLPAWLAQREGKDGASVARKASGRVGATLSSRVRSRLSRVLPEAAANVRLRRKYPPAGDVFMLPGSEFMALLRVNLEGREPAGTVPQAQYRDTLEVLRDDLLGLVNATAGTPAVAETLFLHDLYRGRCANILPDVVVRWANDAPIQRLDCPRYGEISQGIRFMDVTHSCHTGHGMAVIAGPGIPKGQRSTRRDLTELTATFYALLGEEPPQHLESRPIDLGLMAHPGS